MASNHYEDEVFKNKRIPKNPIKYSIIIKIFTGENGTILNLLGSKS